MLRYNIIMIALGGVAFAAMIPKEPADAQSGQALVFAERACLDYGVATGTAPFASCVKRSARAFDRGEPDIAYQQARLTRDAHDSCCSEGIAPETPGYGQCVASRVDHAQH